MDAKPIITADLWQLTISELSHGFMAQQFLPSDLMKQLIERIDLLNPLLNAYIHINGELMSMAQQSDQRWLQGRPLSLLDGIPISVKDNLNVANMPTSWGNQSLKHALQMTSEACVAQCELAGMIVIGKTNVPEFTSEGITYNPTFGHTRNPWNLDLTPGGSSGGVVSSIASGMAVCGIGTDGGGSIRRPAAHTGLFGLKPTTELISREHGLPRFMFDFEVAGPIARSVDDLATLFQVMSSHAVEPFEVLSSPTNDRPLNILVVDTLGDNPVDSEIIYANRKLAVQLEKFGHELNFSFLPLDLSPFDKVWPLVNQMGIAYLFECLPLAENVCQSKFKQLAKQGRDYSSSDVMALWQVVLNFRQQVKLLFKKWDVIVMPSIATMAWPIGQEYPPEIAGQAVNERGHAVYTGWVNMAGNPAISVPCGVSSQGQPMGIQLIADWYQEPILLRLAKKLEQTTSQWRWPELIDERAALHSRVMSEENCNE